VRLGSDFTGYGSDALALKFCGLKVKTVFCAEIDPHMVAVVCRVHDVFGGSDDKDGDFIFYRMTSKSGTTAPLQGVTFS